MNSTPRLALEMLTPGQAQKEFLHNEALQTLDMLVMPAVEETPRASPPTAPVMGSCYIVDSSATEEWVGKAQCIAAFTSGGWRFVAPLAGLSVYVRSIGTWAMFRGEAWELGGAAIASPSAGAIVDAEARSAIDQMLSAMRQHGIIAA